MTIEEKQLLLIDLCARQPYGLKVKCGNTVTKEICELIGINAEISSVSIKDRWAKHYLENVASIKPYLRPLSSMTDVEFHSIEEYTELKYDQIQRVLWEKKHTTLEFYLNEVPQYCLIKVFDWLNRHHFDYRGLIEQGLALEAPEDMYNL